MHRVVTRAAALVLAAAIAFSLPATMAAASEPVFAESEAQETGENADAENTAGGEGASCESANLAEPVETQETDPGQTEGPVPETTEEPDADDNGKADQEDAGNAGDGNTIESGTALPEEPERSIQTEKTAGKENASKKRGEPVGSTEEPPAATEEPDWLKGGTGSSTDISSSVDIRFTKVHWLHYGSYGLGDWDTCTYDAVLNEGETLTDLICADPRKNGYGLKDKSPGAVYEYNTPMLVKAAYYGTGPGSSTLRGIVDEVMGTPENAGEICCIAAHIAISQIYAYLHERDSSMGSVKSSPGDGFIQVEPVLVEIVNRFGKAIEDLPVPDNYYVYVLAVDSRSKQDFAYGSYRIKTQTEKEVKLVKTSSDPGILGENKCYSLAGAEYGVYTDEDCTDQAGVLTTDETGKTDTISLTEGGKYFVKEIHAPMGYYRDKKTYEVLAEGDEEVLSFDLQDTPGTAKTKICIIKKNRGEELQNSSSLAGTEFTVEYYDGYYDEESLPEESVRTWVIRTIDRDGICAAELQDENLVSGELYKSGDEVVLPLGTITIRETKAAPGYINDGDFGDGRKVFVGHIALNEEQDGTEFVPVAGKPEILNEEEIQFTVLDTPEKPDTPEEPETPEKPEEPDKPDKPEKPDTPAQKPKKPLIGTCARDKETGKHMAEAGTDVTIEDTISYRDLDGGKEYIMRGRMVEKDTGETLTSDDGIEVTASVRFTAESSGNGEVIVPFTFRAGSEMEGKTLVAFETAEEAETGKVIARHEDLDDVEQSIRFYSHHKSADTGDSNQLHALLFCIAVSTLAILTAAHGKKEK